MVQGRNARAVRAQEEQVANTRAACQPYFQILKRVELLQKHRKEIMELGLLLAVPYMIAA